MGRDTAQSDETAGSQRAGASWVARRTAFTAGCQRVTAAGRASLSRSVALGSTECGRSGDGPIAGGRSSLSTPAMCAGRPVGSPSMATASVNRQMSASGRGMGPMSCSARRVSGTVPHREGTSRCGGFSGRGARIRTHADLAAWSPWPACACAIAGSPLRRRALRRSIGLSRGFSSHPSSDAGVSGPR